MDINIRILIHSNIYTKYLILLIDKEETSLQYQQFYMDFFFS